MCSLPDPPEALSAHPVDIGQRTEAIVLAALVRRVRQDIEHVFRYRIPLGR